MILLPTWFLKTVHPALVALRWEWLENHVLEELHHRGWYWGSMGFWRPSTYEIHRLAAAYGMLLRISVWFVIGLWIVLTLAYIYLGLEPL